MSGVALVPQHIVALRPQMAEVERIKSLGLDSSLPPHPPGLRPRALGVSRLVRRHRADGFTKATVQSYRAEIEARGLSASAVNVQLAAIRQLATEAADNGLLAPELAAGIAKVRGARSPAPASAKFPARDPSARWDGGEVGGGWVGEAWRGGGRDFIGRGATGSRASISAFFRHQLIFQVVESRAG